MPERDPKTGRFPKRAPAVPGGAGWGGDANGAGKRGSVSGSGRKAGVPLAETKAAVKRETFRAVLEAETAALAKRWIEIAKNDDHPHQHTMILKAAELQGEFKQSVELTGPNNGPMQTKVTIEIVEPENPGPAPV